MSQFEIEIREPGKEPRRLPLRAGLGIGRHPDNDCPIDDPKVSAFHARFDAEGDGFVLVDVGSSNGTHVIDGASLGKDERQAVTGGLRFMTGFTEFEIITVREESRPEATRMMSIVDEPVIQEEASPEEKEAAPAAPGPEIPVSRDLPPIPPGRPRPEARPLDVASKDVLRSPNSELSPVADMDSASEAFPSVDYEIPVEPPKPKKKPASPEAAPASDLSEEKTVGHPRVVFDDAGPGPDPDEATILSPPERGGEKTDRPRDRRAESESETVKTPLPSGIARIVSDADATWVADAAPEKGALPKADEGLSFMRPRLVVAAENQRLVEVISSREFSIGRRHSGGAQLVDCAIDSPAVSSNHAAIVFRQGRFFLEDRGSRNGTLVGGKKLDAMASREIKADDHLVFGMADALFVVDRDHQLRELPRAPYRDALDQLVRKKLIDRQQADLLWQRCAVDGEHPAESLLLSGAVSVRQWCQALDAVGRPAQTSGGGRRSVQVLLIAVAILLLAAIAVLVLKFR